MLGFCTFYAVEPKVSGDSAQGGGDGLSPQEIKDIPRSSRATFGLEANPRRPSSLGVHNKGSKNKPGPSSPQSEHGQLYHQSPICSKQLFWHADVGSQVQDHASWKLFCDRQDSKLTVKWTASGQQVEAVGMPKKHGADSNHSSRCDASAPVMD